MVKWGDHKGLIGASLIITNDKFQNAGERKEEKFAS